VRIELRYGAGSLPVEISQRLDSEVIIPRAIIEHPDILDQLHRSLNKPTSSEPLAQLLTGIKTVAVVVNSEQDIEFNKSLLSLLLDFFDASINDPENISILFSPKEEYPFTGCDVDLLLGEPSARGYQVLIHNPNDNESLCYIGDTPNHSTPIFINRMFAEADLTIGLGTIRCNGFIGATGGRMSVVPHVSGSKTIIRNTKLQATHPVGPFMLDSQACVDMADVSKIAGLDFIINAVPSCENYIAQISAGEPDSAWHQGVDACRTVTEAIIQKKADIAIVSTGGGLNDVTLFAAVDSLFAAHAATEHGGSIILVAECVKGLGPSGFLIGISNCASSSEVALLSETNFELGMEKAQLFWKILNSRNLIICSRLRESLVSERLHCIAVHDPQEGFEVAKGQMVSSPRVAIIPHGHRTLPIIRSR
jgi:nickel-dependent lactate racemase